jgi:hypothetical protein
MHPKGAISTIIPVDVIRRIEFSLFIDIMDKFRVIVSLLEAIFK